MVKQTQSRRERRANSAGAAAALRCPSSSMKCTLLALEPRIMFDAAAAATAAEMAPEQTAQQQAEASANVEAESHTAASTTDAQDPLLQAITTYDPPAERREIVFVDTSVLNYEA